MLIGIAGIKRSGKDSIANYLIKKYEFEKYSLATPLKKMVCEAFNWDFNEVEKDENKEKIDAVYGISYRQACQHIGTDWAQYSLPEKYPAFKKTTGKLLWVKRFESYYNQNKDKDIVVADIRFPHEEEAIHRLGGKLIRVTRPDVQFNDIHESEQYINKLKVDFDICNNATLKDLYSEVDYFFIKKLMM